MAIKLEKVVQTFYENLEGGKITGRKCLKCESLCRTGAISITNDGYYIDPQKCVHCKKCVNAKYLDGGCMMDKYLRTK